MENQKSSTYHDIPTNPGAIKLSENPIQTQAEPNILISNIISMLESKFKRRVSIKFKYISTTNQIADGLTKAIGGTDPAKCISH